MERCDTDQLDVNGKTLCHNVAREFESLFPPAATHLLASYSNKIYVKECNSRNRQQRNGTKHLKEIAPCRAISE